MRESAAVPLLDGATFETAQAAEEIVWERRQLVWIVNQSGLINKHLHRPSGIAFCMIGKILFLLTAHGDCF